eukprot:13795346-Alexandrium_andersonii.AAC.1
MPELASGVRTWNCAVPRTTSNSTPEGLVRGVRRHFARWIRWRRRNGPAGAPDALFGGSGGRSPPGKAR